MGHYDEQREVFILGNLSVSDTPKGSGVNVVQSNSWYDYENNVAHSLPPVGECCEYTLTGNSWFKCSIVSQNKLVISCPHIAEMDDNGNGLQVIHPESVQFRPLDWALPPLPPEFNFHLANALNELGAAFGLLDVQSTTSELLIHARRLIQEVKGTQQ